MTTKTFTHALGAAIALALSGEKGIVTGRAEYENSEDAYFVRYVDGTGCQRSEWFGESALEGDANSISPEAAAAHLATQGGTDASATTHATGANLADRDSKNLPWDARIHASTKRKNQDGSWTIRKGVDKGLVAKVEAELLQMVNVPVAIGGTPAAAPVGGVPSLPPVPGAVAAPALPEPPQNPIYTNFVAFLAQHTNSPTNPGGRLTADWIKAVLLQYQVADGSLQNLAHRPDLIPNIEATIKGALGLT